MKLFAWYSAANPFGEVLTEEQIYGSWELARMGEGPVLHVSTVIKAEESLSMQVVAMHKPGGKCGISLAREGAPNVSAMGQGDGSAALSVYCEELQGYLNLIVSETNPAGGA